jgi:hypothetical protein
MHSLYAISLFSQTLRLVRVSSNQNTRWRLSFFFWLTDKGQEFICCFHPYHSWLSQYRRMVVSAPHIRDSGIKCFLKLYCTQKKKKAFYVSFKRFPPFLRTVLEILQLRLCTNRRSEEGLVRGPKHPPPQVSPSSLQIKLADGTPWWVLFSLFWMN